MSSMSEFESVGTLDADENSKPRAIGFGLYRLYIAFLWAQGFGLSGARCMSTRAFIATTTFQCMSTWYEICAVPNPPL